MRPWLTSTTTQTIGHQYPLFRRRPADVGAFVRAFIEGAQAAGALATAKPFSRARRHDNRFARRLAGGGREQGAAGKLELVPFRARLASGVARS